MSSYGAYIHLLRSNNFSQEMLWIVQEYLEEKSIACFGIDCFLNPLCTQNAKRKKSKENPSRLSNRIKTSFERSLFDQTTNLGVGNQQIITNNLYVGSNLSSQLGIVLPVILVKRILNWHNWVLWHKWLVQIFQSIARDPLWTIVVLQAKQKRPRNNESRCKYVRMASVFLYI